MKRTIIMIALVLLYACFLGLIGFSVWWLDSGWPLLLLMVSPTFTFKEGE